MIDALVDTVAATLGELVPADQSVLVAVSGGPDSVAMLELLHRGAARHGRRLVVGHVDHGIHPESASMARRVIALAASRGLPGQLTTVALGPTASETTARRARRDALSAMADACGAGAIALAHHADDQAETIMLRVLRGSGPAGLAGMAPRSGRWVRPVLTLERATLRGWLEEHGGEFWDDPANRDHRHLRSWVRHEVIPRLEARLPDLRTRLWRLGEQALSARQAWDAVPESLPALDLRDELGGLSVAASPLRGYRSALRRAILGALGRRFGVQVGARRADAIERLVALRRSGRSIRVDPGLEVELAGDRLILRRPVAAPPSAVDLPEVGEVSFGAWQVRCGVGSAAASVRGGAIGWFTPGPLQLGTWQSGDRIRPLGGSGSRRVSVVLREAGVPRGRRALWPVIRGPVDDDATILWVPGICRGNGRVPTEGKEARHLYCTLA